jgi:hypothetical protein
VFRNDTDADIVRDHLANAFECPHEDSEFQRVAGASGVLAEIVLQRASRAQANKGVFNNSLKCDPPFFGKRIAARHNQNKTVNCEGRELQCAMIDGIRDDPDIGLTAGYCFDDFRAQTLPQVDIDIWMAL